MCQLNIVIIFRKSEKSLFHHFLTLTKQKEMSKNAKKRQKSAHIQAEEKEEKN